MIRRPFVKTDTDRDDSADDAEGDEALWSSLEHSAAAFARAQRESLLPQVPDSGAALPLWSQGRGWGLRAAAVFAILFLVLGFVAGRHFDDPSFQSADIMFPSPLTGGTAWQFFVAILSLSGESNDIVE